jgi:hypothetical protein
MMARKTPENEEDFIRMQQEAIRRVRDMQQRARRTLEDAGVPLERREEQTPPPPTPEPPPPQPQTPRPAQPQTPRPTQPQRESHRGPVTQSVWNAPVAPMRPSQPVIPFPPPPAASKAPPYAEPAAATRQTTGHPHGGGPLAPLLGNLLPSVHISLDSEQVMLIVLVFLLYQDQADHFLLLALAYILFI